MEKYDVIVIGAGNGGLSAAASLADKGKRVVVLEKHHLPGGFATSFVRGRFEFEVSLHELCLFTVEKSDARIRELFDEIGMSEKVDWCKVPEAFALIGPESESKNGYVVPFGVKNFIENIDKYIPGAGKSAEKIFYLADKVDESIQFFSSLKNGLSPDVLVKLLSKHLLFLRIAMYSVEDVMKALKIDGEAKKILEGYWSYLGVGCSKLSFAHYAMMTNAYIKYGATVPYGRSQELSNAFVESIEENGGSVWLNTEAKEIIVENNSVKGVRLSDGRLIECANVIAAVSPNIVYGKLIAPENVPEHCKKLTNARKFAARGVVIFLGLNKSPEELGIDIYSSFIYNAEDTDTEFEQMKSIDTNKYMVAVCLNKAVPDCSPQGTAMLTLTTLLFGDEWDDISDEEYVAKKRELAEKMICTYETRTGIKIREYIEEIEIASPVSFAHYTGTPQGSIYGYLSDEWDGVMHRSIFDGMDEKINGLHMCGGFGSMLNGYSSAIINGKAAADKTLSDMEKEVRI